MIVAALTVAAIALAGCGSSSPASAVRRALARTIAAGTARIAQPGVLDEVVDFRIPAEQSLSPGEGLTPVGGTIPTYTEDILCGHSQYLREVARSPAQEHLVDPFLTRWRRQGIANTALSPLETEVGGTGGTYRYAGRSSFGGRPVGVYTISRPTATFDGMTVVAPRIVVLVDGRGLIVRLSVTQSQYDKALGSSTRRGTSTQTFYDFGVKATIRCPP